MDVHAIFTEELTRRGVVWSRLDDGAYVIDVRGTKVTASLDNVGRNAVREGDIGIVLRFLDTVVNFRSLGDCPWSEARNNVFVMLESSNVDLGDALQAKTTDELRRVIVVTNEEHSEIACVTPAMVARWEVATNVVTSHAERNLDRIVRDAALDTQGEAAQKLGMLQIPEPFKASSILSRELKQLVKSELGWPILVVVPCRDFMYLLPEGSPLLGNLGQVVVEEFTSSGYPLTTEVLRLSDDGFEAIGKFQVPE